MIPNVWSAQEFKRHSSKAFSRRSLQLKAIDDALAKAHTANMQTDHGAEAVVHLLQAIATWRASKAAQGKTSGRARAVDTLQDQLKDASERIYRRKVDQLNMTAPWVEQTAHQHQAPVDPRSIQKDLGKMLHNAQRPKVPPRPHAKVPPPVPPRGVPTRTASQDRLFDHLAQAMIARRAKVMAYDDEDLFDDLEASQKGRLSAKWMLSVPPTVTDVDAARAEALRVIAAMLGNDVDVIKRLLENRVEVVVVPRDTGMTVLEQFATIRGDTTFDGRSWDTVRGVGNVSVPSAGPPLVDGRGPSSIVAIDTTKNRIYTAVAEENLLGGPTTAPGAGCYNTGYSTTTHEFGHSIHEHGLSDADRATFKRAFDLKTRAGDHEMWVDGPRVHGGKQCYASMNEFEYFAQLTNAWLGSNTGSDPYTGRPRNNGRQWVMDNEPKMITDIFDRIYGKRSIKGLNPAIIVRS